MRLDAVAHAHQPVRGAALRVGVEADAVVAHRDLDLVAERGKCDPDRAAGLRVFGDVGDRLLHQTVHHQLAGGVQPHRIQRTHYFQPGAFRIFPRQDFEGGHQPQVAQGRGPQVFDDAAFEGNATVQRFNQVAQPLLGFGRGTGEPRLDARRVQLGRGEQGTQLVVQVARQAAALVFARGLQVLGELGELGGAKPYLRLQPVALGLHRALEFELLLHQYGRLAKV